MTMKACFIAFGVAIIIWLGVTATHLGVTASQSVNVILAGS